MASSFRALIRIGKKLCQLNSRETIPPSLQNAGRTAQEIMFKTPNRLFKKVTDARRVGP
jgi:hypothetical protein